MTEKEREKNKEPRKKKCGWDREKGNAEKLLKKKRANKEK